MKFPIKDFFSKCDQISRKLWILSHLLKRFLMENFIFSAVQQRFCSLSEQSLRVKSHYPMPRSFIYKTLSVIWYHLCNFKKSKSTHWGVLLVAKLQAEVKLLHGCFSRFSNCTNSTKLGKPCHIKFHSKRCRVGENRNIKLYENSPRFSLFQGNFVNINYLTISNCLKTNFK